MKHFESTSVPHYHVKWCVNNRICISLHTNVLFKHEFYSWTPLHWKQCVCNFLWWIDSLVERLSFQFVKKKRFHFIIFFCYWMIFTALTFWTFKNDEHKTTNNKSSGCWKSKQKHRNNSDGNCRNTTESDEFHQCSSVYYHLLTIEIIKRLDTSRNSSISHAEQRVNFWMATLWFATRRKTLRSRISSTTVPESTLICISIIGNMPKRKWRSDLFHEIDFCDFEIPVKILAFFAESKECFNRFELRLKSVAKSIGITPNMLA